MVLLQHHMNVTESEIECKLNWQVKKGLFIAYSDSEYTHIKHFKKSTISYRLFILIVFKRVTKYIRIIG